jgi:hypothetical protein
MIIYIGPKDLVRVAKNIYIYIFLVSRKTVLHTLR